MGPQKKFWVQKKNFFSIFFFVFCQKKNKKSILDHFFDPTLPPWTFKKNLPLNICPCGQVVIYLMVQCRDPGSIPGSTISFISYPLILVLGIFVFFVLKSIFNYNAISCHYIIQKTSSFDPVILLLYTIFVCKWKLRKVAKCKQVSNYVTRV